MRIYISGPISGTDDAEERFQKALGTLRICYPIAVTKLHFPECEEEE